jgi:hypothetical protein
MNIANEFLHSRVPTPYLTALASEQIANPKTTLFDITGFIMKCSTFERGYINISNNNYLSTFVPISKFMIDYYQHVRAPCATH